jgi:single-strand DNA-binding protein
MALPTVNGEFRVVTDPELRFTQSGKAVASARIAANSRKKDDSTGEWKDDKECFLNLTIWGREAENFVESCEKGTLVLLSGRLETRNYETREGEKRTSFDVTADSFGPSLRWSTAKITKTERQSGGGSAPAEGAAPAAPAEDPWATPQDDEPPF